MVLAELGRKITSALQKLNKSTVINEAAVKECMGIICNALLGSDINVKYVMRLRENVMSKFKNEQDSGANLRNLIKAEVVRQLTNLLKVERELFVPKKGKANIVMFVGLQGSGKTTTCAKYAYYYKKKGWRVALVCADTFRAGAFDQLKQNAARIQVPFYGSYFETDPVIIAQEGVEQFKKQGIEIIIVDTSGRHKQQVELFDEMKQVEKAVNPNEIIFVMDGSIGQQCYDQADAYRKAINVGSVIITKLDGHAKGGGALSAVAATKSPIIFFGDGEHFQDLEPFDALSFIKILLGEGNIKKLIESVNDVYSANTQAKLLEKVKKGEFNIRDMKDQFESILKLGSLSSFMSLLPGMGTNIINKENQQESIERIRRFIYIMDSMTAKQLDCENLINDSRMTRIARGSGTSVAEVKILLDEHKKLKGMMNKVTNVNKSKTYNTSHLMNKLQQIVGPKMFAQMDGFGIMDKMKEMSKSDEMSSMMKSMSQLGSKGKKHK